MSILDDLTQWELETIDTIHPHILDKLANGEAARYQIERAIAQLEGIEETGSRYVGDETARNIAVSVLAQLAAYLESVE